MSTDAEREGAAELELIRLRARYADGGLLPNARLYQPQSELMPTPVAIAKRLATAKARAALQGIEVHAIEADAGGLMYIATKHAWAMTRSFDGADALAEVERWLDRVEGKA